MSTSRGVAAVEAGVTINGEMTKFDGGNTGRNCGNVFIGSSCNIGCCSNENVDGKGRSMSEQ